MWSKTLSRGLWGLLYQQRRLASSSSSPRHVLVTGASSGLGRAIAVELSRDGYALTLTGRNQARLDETKDMCTKLTSNKVLTVSCDVTNDDQVKACMETAVNTHGSLYGLVNNAALLRFADISTDPSISMELLDLLYRTNLRAVYLFTSLAVPHLIASKGSVVNVSTVAAKRVVTAVNAYGSLKAALNHFSLITAMDLGPQQVRVNTISPGYFPTNLAPNAGMTEEDVQKLTKSMSSITPLQRFGKSEEVGYLVSYLMSDKAAFITGTNIDITGGLHHGALELPE